MSIQEFNFEELMNKSGLPESLIKFTMLKLDISEIIPLNPNVSYRNLVIESANNCISSFRKDIVSIQETIKESIRDIENIRKVVKTLSLLIDTYRTSKERIEYALFN